MQLNLPMPNVEDDVRCQYKLRQGTEIDHCVQIENPNGPNPGERIWYRPGPISYYVPDSNVTILQFRWLWLWASLNPAALVLWPWPKAGRKGTSPWRSLVEALCNHIQILISILQNPFPAGWKMKPMLCAFNVKQIPNYKELHLLWVGKTTKLHIPLENTIVNCISTDSSFRSRLHNWHQIINEDARCSIGAENLKHQITIRLNVIVEKEASITLKRGTLLLRSFVCKKSTFNKEFQLAKILCKAKLHWS